MRFSLYDAESTGNLVWGPEEWSVSTAQVTVTGGLFNVLLGTYLPLESVTFNTGYWLGVEVYNESSTLWDTLI